MRTPKALTLLLGAALTFAFAPRASAVPFSIMIGDNDGYGFASPVPDNGVLPEINLPEDRRSAAEAAATDGAQQTDFYSSVFNPLPESFDVIFSLSAIVNSANLTIDMGGFQADQFGQLSVAFNGVAQPNFFNFQDGAFATMVRSWSLDATALANANSAGEFVITISRNGSNDAISFDYFELDGESKVPEPTTMMLLGAGLLTGALRRRRS
jgi:hypothetical protein